METFFWSLALAAITGLTFASYKHPTAFAQNLFPPLLTLAMLGVIGSIAWYMGGMNSLAESLQREVAGLKDERGTLKFLIESVVLSFGKLKYGVGISLLVAVYLLLLKYLPSILNLRRDSPEEPPSKPDP